MRLYLSSYQLGAHPEVLARLVHGDRRGWVVANALDGHDETRRRTDTKLQIEALARGGNVFTRMALARSGLDRVVINGLAADRFVYAGFSAGPCVLAPTLRGLEVCDPLDICRATYGEVRYDGLGVLDRPVVPLPQLPRASRGRLAFSGCREGLPPVRLTPCL